MKSGSRSTRIGSNDSDRTSDERETMTPLTESHDYQATLDPGRCPDRLAGVLSANSIGLQLTTVAPYTPSRMRLAWRL